MRAKEYAAFFHRNEEAMGRDQALKEMFFLMNDELQQILKARKCRRDAAAYSAMLEMNDRWNAMCKIIPGFKRDGFKRFWDSKISEMGAKP